MTVDGKIMVQLRAANEQATTAMYRNVSREQTLTLVRLLAGKGRDMLEVSR